MAFNKWLIASLLLYCINGQAQDLSNNDWKLWLDTAAEWQNDSLYVPPVAIERLPVRIPSGGWEVLQQGRVVHLPATVEEYHWGNKFGVGGNYIGVSWFTTKLSVPAALKGKRIVLHFESVRFRAEVFVNRKLCGYDLITGTPFDVDISAAVLPGADNEIAVRITDPNGNFDWRDSQNFMWGDYRTQPTHGFGGITGKVTLVATDKMYIEDVFVKNKPALKEIDIQVAVQNATGTGKYILDIKDGTHSVYRKEFSGELNPVNTFTVKLPSAKLWSVDEPNLYTVTVHCNTDSFTRRFGFRWFEVRDVKGDKQFYLNNKRIVLRTSISWGFWPENGIAPSDALARKQIADAKALGLNMLNFHRTIGQTNVLDYADELGLLYFEEPGGNSYPEQLFNPSRQTDFYLGARTEKFLRMIKRDRSHPSLVIYNMHNERGAQPHEVDRAQMRAGRALDDSRIMTYNSCNGAIKVNEPDPKFKLHLLPYDTTFYGYGWFDQHHAGGPGVYHDNLYSDPTHYAKYFDHPNEIIYYGEEGAIGTPPRLQLIRDTILKRGPDIGWESAAYLKWYDAYDSFLKNNGFNKAFPNVDSLTRKMGNVAYYYQGRIIENIRINNTIDGYAVNGWESMKLENHSGIVDNYRNLKGDAELIAKYNQPLYVAVKLNKKVVRVGDTVTVDLFLVNEKGIRGKYVLDVNGMRRSVSVTNQYGQLLLAGHKIAVTQPGYTNVTASLGAGIAKGSDEVYAVELDTSGLTNITVADTSRIVSNYLKSIGVPHSEYRSGRPQGKHLVVGAFEPQQTGNPLVTDILEWVNNGNTLIVVNNIERWADHLAKKEAIDYRGARVLGTSWYGGNYFTKEHALLKGLPQNCVFNWEYQCFATYNKSRIGLRINNGDCVVACVSDHKPEVYTALHVIPHGRGRIILCALDIFSCIKALQNEKRAEGDGENASMNTFNTSRMNNANIVGQQLLLNMLRF